ncbi:MAG: hypothetical protein IAF02_12395 [Anaerolineae bacterium]|nr:hypothetical protein [Anaerolineae bacterium]
MPKLSRRPSVPQFNTYQSYKQYLREDFQYCCIYCAIHENEYGGPRGFTVEHFRPKSIFTDLTNDYKNLLYGCNICNPFKGNDWPSDDPLFDGVGYLDPCEHDYDAHFRLKGFEIEGLTQPALYMIERLHLNRRQLVKLRQKRWDEEAVHVKTLQEFHEQIELIDTAIHSQQLSPAIQEQFHTLKQTIANQLHVMIEKWERRWEPLYTLEDYR